MLRSLFRVVGRSFPFLLAACAACVARVAWAAPLTPATPVPAPAPPAPAPAPAAAPHYQLTALGDFETPQSGGRGHSGEWYGVSAINNQGQVVGWMGSKAFLWEKGTLRALEAPPDSSRAWAWAINERGQVVGAAQTRHGDRAVLWDKQGGPAMLGILGKEEGQSTATGINNQGVVVGNAVISVQVPLKSQSASNTGDVGDAGGAGSAQNTDTKTRWLNHTAAFMWSAQEGMSELVLPESLRRAPTSLPPRTYIVGIDDRGEVLGTHSSGTALLWRQQQPQVLNPPPDGSALLYPPGYGGIALDNQGRALLHRAGGLVRKVGKGYAPDGPSYLFWANSKATPLSGFTAASVHAMNSRGEIVGDFRPSPEAKSERWSVLPGCHAFLWRNGHQYDLNDLIAPGSGWILESATGINDQGQIVGTGFLLSDVSEDNEMRKRGFLLEPTSVP